MTIMFTIGLPKRHYRSYKFKRFPKQGKQIDHLKTKPRELIFVCSYMAMTMIGSGT